MKMTNSIFTNAMIWDLSKRFTTPSMEFFCMQPHKIYDPRWKLSTTLAAKRQHPITILYLKWLLMYW